MSQVAWVQHAPYQHTMCLYRQNAGGRLHGSCQTAVICMRFLGAGHWTCNGATAEHSLADPTPACPHPSALLQTLLSCSCSPTSSSDTAAPGLTLAAPAPAAAGGSGGGGGGFGFSFPTTPPSAVDAAVHEERAERVFSTWASNHSRSGLDAAGASDDEGAGCGRVYA